MGGRLNLRKFLCAAAALVTAIGVAAVAPTGAEESVPTIWVSQSTGLHAGDMIDVHGSGFQPNEQITLMMFTGFIGGYAPDTAIPVTADEFGNFHYTEWGGYPVSRLINAKIGPFVDEFAWTDCAALNPESQNACYLGTFGGSWAETPLGFEQTWVQVDTNSSGTVGMGGGLATVSGEVTCPALPHPFSPTGVESATVGGTLYQRIGRKTVATGTFATQAITCTGDPAAWSAVVYPTGGVPFGNGSAEITARSEIVTLGAWIPSDTSTGVVRLKVQPPRR